MGKSSVDTYGAQGQSKVMHFATESLTIITDPKHALYDDRATQELSDEFVCNVDYYGILEPIVVRKDPETGKIEVVAGRQRVRAAIEVNKRRKKKGEKLLLVPAIVNRGDDLRMMGVMVTENEQRVANTPMQRANLAQRMFDRGATIEQVTTTLGCSAATVKNLQALLEAPAAVRNAVQNGKVSAAAAYKLARLPAAEAKAKLAEATTAAPRTKGKRDGAARRQMEVVTGVKKTVVGRTAVEIESMRDIVEENDDLAGEIKRVMVAVFDWMLGAEADLREICGMDEVDEEEEIEDIEEETGEA
jgi:ParB family chromosome partitioning protein